MNVASTSGLRASLALAGRTTRIALRRVQFFAPTLIFPTMLLAVNSSGLGRATQLPGFPHVQSFFDFQLAASITQSLLLGAVSAGIATGLEIEEGFFDRLVVAPIPRTAIIAGRLFATTIFSVIQASFFIVLGLIFGAEIVSGVPGIILVLVVAAISGTGFGAAGIVLALRTKSVSVIEGFFPLVFVMLFMSSAFFPQDLLTSPASEIARYNPLSYIANGIRNPIISSISASTVIEGVLAGLLVLVVMSLLAVYSLRGRLRNA